MMLSELFVDLRAKQLCHVAAAAAAWQQVSNLWSVTDFRIMANGSCQLSSGIYWYLHPVTQIMAAAVGAGAGAGA